MKSTSHSICLFVFLSLLQTIKGWCKNRCTSLCMKNECKHKHQNYTDTICLILSKNLYLELESSTERTMSGIRNHVHTSELTSFYFTQALPFYRHCGFKWSFLWSAAPQFTVHVPAQPTKSFSGGLCSMTPLCTKCNVASERATWPTA